MDLDKLSYNVYGNLVIVVLIILAILFNLFPFSFVGFMMCIMQIPIYLFVRSRLKEPIHARGLNICFFLTSLFYCLMFLVIRLSNFLMGETFTLVLATLLCVLGCYATSTVPNKQEEKGKLFFGRKKENGRYADLHRFVKFNPTDKRLCQYEDRLKETDMFTYYIFKYIFRDGLTWDETMDKLDIYERKDLDKEIYAIYKTLQYVLDLKRLD